jgi:hypothetical protein
MKKLLILVMVLAMASLASATLTLSTTSTGPLAAEETATLSVGTDAVISAGVGEGYWAIGTKTVDGTNTGGISLYAATEGGITIAEDAVGSGIPLPEGENGVWGMIALGTIPSVPIGGIIDEITFTCKSAVDVVVTLYYSVDAVEFAAVDTVTITQIPEPVTMVLLGLGGLLLRRRVA